MASNLEWLPSVDCARCGFPIRDMTMRWIMLCSGCNFVWVKAGMPDELPPMSVAEHERIALYLEGIGKSAKGGRGRKRRPTSRYPKTNVISLRDL